MQNNIANANANVRGGIVHIPSASITTNTTTVLAVIDPFVDVASTPISQGNFRIDLKATAISGTTVLSPLVEFSKDGGTTWSTLTNDRFVQFGVINNMEQDVTAVASSFQLTTSKAQQGFGVVLNVLDSQSRYRVSVVSTAISGTAIVQGVAVFVPTKKNEMML